MILEITGKVVSTVKTRQRIVHVPETRQVTKAVLERMAVPKLVTVIQQVLYTVMKSVACTKTVMTTRLGPKTVTRPVVLGLAPREQIPPAACHALIAPRARDVGPVSDHEVVAHDGHRADADRKRPGQKR